MDIRFAKSFQKMLLKLPKPIQNHFWERLDLFREDQYNYLLNNHSLTGEYSGCRSINVTGDFRCIFTIQNDVVWFLYIGTHSQLYE